MGEIPPTPPLWINPGIGPTLPGVVPRKFQPPDSQENSGIPSQEVKGMRGGIFPFYPDKIGIFRAWIEILHIPLAPYGIFSHTSQKTPNQDLIIWDATAQKKNLYFLGGEKLQIGQGKKIPRI